MTTDAHLQPAQGPSSAATTAVDRLRVGNPVAAFEPVLFTYEETAKMLGISVSWLRKQGALGNIPVTRLGRAVRFSAENVQQIIDDHREAPRPPARPAPRLGVAEGCRPSRRARG
jgi:excisionase family DNA binding protein